MNAAPANSNATMAFVLIAALCVMETTIVGTKVTKLTALPVSEVIVLNNV